MARPFNPLDPLGLFEKERRTELPDPLGLFKARNPGEEIRGRYLPPPPDPLGIFNRGGVEKERFNPLDPLGLLKGRKAGAIGNPIPIEFDGHLVEIKNQARQILIGRGYPPQQVDMALKWAEEWLMGMARRMAPGNIELQKSVVQSAYAEIASRAEKWLMGIEAAFAVPAGAR